MVIYDGIHYDALALAPSADAPEELDTTAFDVTSGADAARLEAIEALALEVTRVANKVTRGVADHAPPLTPETYVSDVWAKITREPGRAETVPSQQHKFTDLAKFTLRCSVCQQGLVGQREAQAHAVSTGHSAFQEYA